MNPHTALSRWYRWSFLGTMLACATWVQAQQDADLRKRAAALFDAGDLVGAAPLYSQLVSLHPQDHELNYRYGASSLYSGADKEKSIGFLKYAVQGGTTPPLAWYYLGQAYHRTYRFKEALAAYERYRGTADKKVLTTYPVDQLEQQGRNGLQLLSNLRDIDVMNKMEVDAADFFRFYDLGDIGGKIVTLPDELKSSLDKKSGERTLVYLPDGGGPIYFSSYGKDGRTGRDIYRTELVGGVFATPVKVAGYINTDRDEDFAVMAPDRKSFYFCSKGHNSMGGYDVFRSVYDKANDVFGPPENMDFAVNTPGDDLLYIVDAEGRQACFASGRDSKQGMLHVYRVGTRQTPVNITVIKGTFASAFDAKDRKARIVVEDAVTREKVGEMRTDMNGEYSFALPRGGRYKFLVQGGPGDLTHAGMVEVPRSDKPMAYRQEMSLVDQGGPKLMIKNYFDAPLEEDMMALALAEVQRRARLEVTGERKHDEVAPAVEAPGDPMTAAGFAGNVTVLDAQRMAIAEEKTQQERAAGLESSAAAAWARAATEAEDAKQATMRAEELVRQAAATPDEGRRTELMVQAARERHQARAAVVRGNAAHRSATLLEAALEEGKLSATEMTALRVQLEQAMSSGDKAALQAPLKQLKGELDERARHDGSSPEEVQARKSASASKQEADKAMDRARSIRQESTELATRIARLERERDAAKGSAKTRLEGEVATLREQHVALEQEVAAAFNKALKAERTARIAEGQQLYIEHLAKEPAPAVEAMPATTRAGMENDLRTVETRVEALGIDERYTGLILEELRQADLQMFAVLQGRVPLAAPVASNLGGMSAPPKEEPTTAGAAGDQGGSTTSAGTTEPSGGGDVASVKPSVAAPKEGPAGTGSSPGPGPTTPEGTRTGGAVMPTNGASSSSTQPANNGAHSTTAVPAGTNGSAAGGASDPSGSARTAATTGGTDAPVGSSTPAGSEQASTSPRSNNTSTATPTSVPTPSSSEPNGTAPVQAVQPVGTTATNTPSSASPSTGTTTPDGNAGSPAVNDVSVEDLAFMRANEIAELRQARIAAEGPAEQARLDQEITRLEKLMREEQRTGGSSGTTMTSEPVHAPPVKVDPRVAFEQGMEQLALDPLPPADHRMAQIFDTTVTEGELVRMVYADHAKHRKRIEEGTVRPGDRPEDLQGLSYMLIDSIDAELARQVVRANARPVEAPVILERIKRLAELKRAEEQQLATLTAQANNANTPADGTDAPGQGVQHTPLNDSYITIPSDRAQVYAAPIEHRAKGIERDLKEWEEELGRIADLEERIDSLEWAFDALPAGKARDRMRDRVDRMIDEHMVRRMEFGQRSAFVNRAEMTMMQDSVEGLRNGWVDKGVDVADPSAHLARALEEEAGRNKERAAEWRKVADRSEDVVLRDSLYRSAYRSEMEALRLYDRSATVHRYLTDSTFVPGEELTYGQVERRLLGDDVPLVVAEVPEELPSPEVTTVRATLPVLVPKAAPTTSEEARQQAAELRTHAASALRTEQQLRQELTTAPRTERAGIERLALRARTVSDSLTRAADQLGNKAEGLEHAERLEAERTALRTRMGRYYQLDGDDLQTIMDNEDQSRFFSVLLLGMEQRHQAEGISARVDSLQRVGATTAADHQLAEAKRMDAMAEANLRHARTLLNAMDTATAARVARLEERGRKPGTTWEPALVAKVEPVAPSTATRPEPRSTATQQEPVPAPSSSTPATSTPATSVPSVQQVPASTNDRPDDPEPIVSAEPPVRSTPPAPDPVRQERTPASSGQTAPSNTNGDRTTSPSANDRPAGNNTTAPSVVPTAVLPPTDVQPTRQEPVVASPSPSSTGQTTRPASNPAPVLAPAGLLAPLAADDFAVGPGTRRSGPIPIDAAMPAGVVFKVQVGAFRKPLGEEAFQDMGPLAGERTANGLVRYTAGMFTTPEAAVRAGGSIRAMGYNDAFVVAYVDGKRVSLDQARQAMTGQTLAQNVPVQRTTPTPVPEPVTPPTPVPTPTPVPSNATAPQSSGADVLSSYPSSAQEILAGFVPATDVASYYNDPTAAPARQVETVQGLFFTVQVGVYSKPTALDRLFNITPLNSEHTETGKIRYTTGVFLSVASAGTRRTEAVGLGVKDAFITAYLNGKRIPMQEANALLARFGPSILAKP